VFKKTLIEISHFKVELISRESVQHNPDGIEMYNTMELIQLKTRAFNTLVRMSDARNFLPTK